MSWQPPAPNNNGSPGFGSPPGGPGAGGFGQPPAGPPPGGPGDGGFGQPPAGPPPGGQLDPHRGTLILVLGLSSFFVMFIGCSACGPMALVSLGLSIPGIVMARKDMRAIDAGAMDPRARDTVQVGQVLCIVSTALSALVGLVMLLMMLLYGGLVGFAILTA